MKTWNQKNLIIIFLAIIVAGSILSFFKINHHPKNKQPVFFVTTAPVLQHDVTIYSETIGTAQAHATVAIKSQVDGELLRVNFKEGDTVHAGQLLFNIDPRSYIIKLQQTKANLAKDQADLTLAQKTLERNRQLVALGYIAKQDYDKLIANLAGLTATVQADQAAVNEATIQLNYCAITAPISGKTGSLTVTPGNLIKVNDPNSLITINQIAPIDIKFSIAEKQFSDLKNNLQAGKVAVQAYLEQSPQVIKTGTLSFTDNTVDPATGTIQLKAIFDNNDQYFWPGQFVKIILPTKQLTKALTVPTKAIQMSQNGSFVFTVTNNIAKICPVTTGANINDSTVITKGLNYGQNVIIDGQLYLSDGTKVQITEPKKTQ